jgi:hypothetical protein
LDGNIKMTGIFELRCARYTKRCTRAQFHTPQLRRFGWLGNFLGRRTSREKRAEKKSKLKNILASSSFAADSSSVSFTIRADKPAAAAAICENLNTRWQTSLPGVPAAFRAPTTDRPTTAECELSVLQCT